MKVLSIFSIQDDSKAHISIQLSILWLQWTSMIRSAAGSLQNDLYRYDPVDAVWSNLVHNVTAGSPPSPRASFGFTSIGTSLYVFGGYDGNGNAAPNYAHEDLR